MSTSLSKHDIDVWFLCIAGALGAVAFILELAGTEMKSDAGEYEEIGKTGNECPIVLANIYSLWSFGWMTPLMKVRYFLMLIILNSWSLRQLGASKFLTEEDMYELLPPDESANLAAQLQIAMQKHTSLWVALFSAYGGPFAVAVSL